MPLLLRNEGRLPIHPNRLSKAQSEPGHGRLKNFHACDLTDPKTRRTLPHSLEKKV